jgi:hypothetical protein
LGSLALPVVVDHVAGDYPDDVALPIFFEPASEVVGSAIRAVGDHPAGLHLHGERSGEHLFRQCGFGHESDVLGHTSCGDTKRSIAVGPVCRRNRAGVIS